MTEPTLLDTLRGPRDLKQMDTDQLETLASQIRHLICEVVGLNGGHMASNLGVVELTLALHREFDFLNDRLIFDVGHQCYTHKILTGRRDRFKTLRRQGGITGLPNPAESDYDLFVSGHAGTALSEAMGMATADRVQGRTGRCTVADIGDGSWPAGMAMEAINHAGDSGTGLVVVLNDNRMSISKSVGGLSNYLSRIRSSAVYNQTRNELKQLVESIPVFGQPIESIFERVRDAVVHWKYGTIFEDLGFRYFGPLDGHDLKMLTTVFKQIRATQFDAPVLVHVFTEKGRGNEAAEADPTAFHGVSPTKVQSDESPEQEGPVCLLPDTYTKVFSRKLVEVARRDERVCGITAAMPTGTGLEDLAEAVPARYIDVGICEQHAVGLAEGLCKAGLRPVVAIYSTFMQRAYDQVFHDLCLQGLPVVLCMDRGGLVGADGPTHHGVFDIAMLRHLPGIVLAAPGDAAELEAILELGLDQTDSPFAIRYPRTHAPDAIPGNDPATLDIGRSQAVREGDDGAIVAYGGLLGTAVQAAEHAAAEGVQLEVVNARWAKPLDEQAIGDLLKSKPFVVTLEEHAVAGGFGSAVLELAARTDGAGARVQLLGVPDRFIQHGTRESLLAECGLDAPSVAKACLALAGKHVTP